VYLMVDRFESTVVLAAIVFFVATSPLGVMITVGAAPSAFGEPFTIRGMRARLGWGLAALLLRGLALRCLVALGLCLFVFPGWYLAIRNGFFAEQTALSNLAGHLHDRRTNELLKGEIGDLFARSAGICLFCALLWFVMLFTFDFASSHLLGLPILFERLKVDQAYLNEHDPFAGLRYFMKFIWSDPVLVTAALAVALLVYPVGRLAWFFCYIDARVRRDCWDMELQIIQEAERLEPA